GAAEDPARPCRTRRPLREDEPNALRPPEVEADSHRPLREGLAVPEAADCERPPRILDHECQAARLDGAAEPDCVPARSEAESHGHELLLARPLRGLYRPAANGS